MIVQNIHINSYYKLFKPILWLSVSTRRVHGMWSNVPMRSTNHLTDVTEAFNEDLRSQRLNLTYETYRDELGKPFVIPSVRRSEQQLAKEIEHKDYVLVSGFPQFCEYSQILAFGDGGKAANAKRVLTLQTYGGTGALALGMQILQFFANTNKNVYISYPASTSHFHAAESTPFERSYYRYYDKQNHTLDFQKLLIDIQKIPKRSIVILQSSAHNPTGVDLTEEQWQELSHLIEVCNLFPFFDMAYQGLASGSFYTDAYAPRHFLETGHDFMVAQSFSTNMTLYGERTGALHIVLANEKNREQLIPHVRKLAKIFFLSPPRNGALIAQSILSNLELRKEWQDDVITMSHRIKSIRTKLREGLTKTSSIRDWKHLTDQVGMFGYTQLNEAQVLKLKKQFSIYLTTDGRISIPSVVASEIDYLVSCLHDVTK